MQYWCTLPFGFGFAAFPFFARELWRLARSLTTAFVLLLALPFLLFVVFWGAANTGLLREGLHPWALVALGASACMWARSERRARWAAPLLATRAVEILAMTVGACVVEGNFVNPLFRWTDAASLVVLCGGTALLAREMLRLMRESV